MWAWLRRLLGLRIARGTVVLNDTVVACEALRVMAENMNQRQGLAPQPTPGEVAITREMFRILASSLPGTPAAFGG